MIYPIHPRRQSHSIWWHCLVGRANPPEAQKSEKKNERNVEKRRKFAVAIENVLQWTHLRSCSSHHIVSKFSHAWLHAHTRWHAHTHTIASVRIQTVSIRRILSYCWLWKRRIVTLVETDIMRTKTTCHAQPFPSIRFFFLFVCTIFLLLNLIYDLKREYTLDTHTHTHMYVRICSWFISIFRFLVREWRIRKMERNWCAQRDRQTQRRKKNIRKINVGFGSPHEYSIIIIIVVFCCIQIIICCQLRKVAIDRIVPLQLIFELYFSFFLSSVFHSSIASFAVKYEMRSFSLLFFFFLSSALESVIRLPTCVRLTIFDMIQFFSPLFSCAGISGNQLPNRT